MPGVYLHHEYVSYHFYLECNVNVFDKTNPFYLFKYVCIQVPHHHALEKLIQRTIIPYVLMQFDCIKQHSKVNLSQK